MYVGQSIARVEDRRFLTGRGNYVDDIELSGARHAVFVRSPHANATIHGDAAAAMPGVVAVLVRATLRPSPSASG